MNRLRQSTLADVALGAGAVALGLLAVVWLVVGAAVTLGKLAEVFS